MDVLCRELKTASLTFILKIKTGNTKAIIKFKFREPDITLLFVVFDGYFLDKIHLQCVVDL